MTCAVRLGAGARTENPEAEMKKARDAGLLLEQITFWLNRVTCSNFLSCRVFEPEKWCPLFLKTP